MQRLRTEYQAIPSEKWIKLGSTVYFAGSCFAHNIQEKCRSSYLPTLSHPFGIVYHPEILNRQLELAFSGSKISEKDLFKYDDLWHSPWHHGSYSSGNPDDCLRRINDALDRFYGNISDCSYAVITLGDGRCYRRLKDIQLVANCHKLPADHFSKVTSSFSEIQQAVDDICTRLLNTAPDIRIILSVSPVRYLKDGFEQNQINKARLLLACHHVASQHVHVNYFPAYELLVDDLRDYRFYADDLTHPSAVAIQYIWEKFISTYFDSEDQKIFEELDKLRKLREHQVLHPDPDRSEKHRQNIKYAISRFQKKYPNLSKKLIWH